METDIRFLIEQGKTYFKNQAYKKAEAVLTRIISQRKEFADVYNMLGVIYHQTGQFSQAIAHFQQAIKINPSYTEAILNLSVLYNDLGEYKLSKQLVAKSKKLIKKSGENLDPFLRGKIANKHAEVADVYRGVGQFAQAIKEYERALELAPHFYDIRNRLAICLRELGKKQEAIREFKKIIKEKPAYSDAHIQLGVTLYSLGHKAEAKRIWHHLARTSPSHQLVRMYLRLSEGKQTSGNGKAKRSR